MLRQHTTFVIGAGASCELDLPSGDGLKDSIIKLLSRSQTKPYGFADERMITIVKSSTAKNVTEATATIENLHTSAEKICRGLPISLSIDNFLHSHSDDVGVTSLGKVAIAQVIIHAERQSKMFKKRTINELGHRMRANSTNTSNDIQNTWYVPFVKLLFSGINVQDVKTVFDKARFVIFNYDRCLEQYLWIALQSYFDISSSAAARILNTVSFIHPYGSLGPLPWQVVDGETFIDLGQDGVDAWQVGDRLRTFTESVQSEIEPMIKDAVSEAETIIILGFGYLEQNVRLLTPHGNRKASRIISTARGISQYDRSIIRDTMAELVGPNSSDVLVEIGTCRELFENFRLTLSLQ